MDPSLISMKASSELYHQHLSNFINSHLPSLPTTEELMQQLQFDFDHQKKPDINHKNSQIKLKHKYEQSTNELQRILQKQKYKQKRSDFQQENNSLKEENLILKNMILKIRDIAIGNSFNPRLQSLKLIKNISYSRTPEIEKMRNNIRNTFDSQEWKITANTNLQFYFDIILNFMIENDEYNVHPMMQMKVPNYSSSNNTFAFHNIPQSQVIGKYRIRNHSRISELHGKFGMRAIMDISENTVLGQYFGVEYLESEFNDAFSGTRELDEKNVFAFNLPVKYLEKNIKIVVDAIAIPNQMLHYMNDCRKDNSVENCTEDDRKCQNVKFVRVYLNGWPAIFAISKKFIGVGDELLANYGKPYVQALKEKKVQSCIRFAKQKMIDNEILKDGLQYILDDLNMNGNKMNGQNVI